VQPTLFDDPREPGVAPRPEALALDPLPAPDERSGHPRSLAAEPDSDAAREAAAPPASSAPSAPKVEVRRSRRRRRTVTAYRDGDTTIVLMPAHIPRAQEQQWVDDMLARLARSESRRRPHDDLMSRAERLARDYLPQPVRPTSVRWVTNQNSRWGSCTPADGTIRLSHRMQGMPAYVIDYVLVHELAHLLVPDHSPAFHAIVAPYPHVAKAQGYLEGWVDARNQRAAGGSSDPEASGSPSSVPSAC
jgi:predicted metal-dependent hydrolase